MNNSVWNTEMITSVFLFLLQVGIFLVIVGIIIFFIKKLNSNGLKILLAILPIVIFILYFNFAPYFFTENYLKSYASNQVLKTYDVFARTDYTTLPVGSDEIPVKREGRQITIEFGKETIVRKGDQYQYSTLVTETEIIEEGLRTQEYYIYRVYEWDKWRFTLIGIGNTGDKPPGIRFADDPSNNN